MIELKTLKELEEKGINSITYAVREELKKEAINWAKSFNKGECHTDFAADGRNGQENIVEWIQHFFNITDEDLK